MYFNRENTQPTNWGMKKKGKHFLFTCSLVLAGAATIVSQGTVQAEEITDTTATTTTLSQSSPTDSSPSASDVVLETASSTEASAPEATLAPEVEVASQVEATTTPETTENNSEEPATSATSEEAPAATSEASESATSEKSESTATATSTTAARSAVTATSESVAPATTTEASNAAVIAPIEPVALAEVADNSANAFETPIMAAEEPATDPATKNVSSWSELVSAAANREINTIVLNNNILAAGDGFIGANGRQLTIKKGAGGSINFGSNQLVATGGAWDITFDGLTMNVGNSRGPINLNNTTGANTVTYKDVTASGTSMYGGGGNTTVVIDGKTTSTVDNASAGKANTYTADSREANIHSAKSVVVAEGANFTLNRSSIGDGINLPDGSTVKVSDGATMTINMNTKNGKESARYHNAGIFMANGGNVVTGRDSNVTINSSIGQAISIGAKRPADNITDADRFGGYTNQQSRNSGPSSVVLGEHSKFNVNGRDGIIMGNNSQFVSGENSVVRFDNKGRGVALDLANSSSITISKNSDTLFESDGKTKINGTGTPSGSYDGYNYIGVNEGGKILVDEYATFRVVMKNRGDNDWDDVVSLDSRTPSGAPQQEPKNK